MKGPSALAIEIKPDESREARLDAVRRLMLALKKDDPEAVEDALCLFFENYEDEGKGDDGDSDEDDGKGGY